MIIDMLQCSNWDGELFGELREGGVTCVHVTVAMWEGARETLSGLEGWYRRFRAFEGVIRPVVSGGDILAAEAEGRTGVILGFQNSSPIEDDLGLVEVFHRLGVRVMQLTYNNQSLLGAGCYEAADGGLTRFGKEVVREMNRVGMIVDLSHVGERTSLEAIEFSERPVAVTHSNPTFLADIPRNKSDKLMKALVEKGGMMGCSLYPHLIGGREVTLRQYCEAVARLAEMIGVEHIGIGSDMVRKCTPAYLQWMRMGRWTHTVDYGAGSKGNPGWPEWQDWFKSPLDFGRLRDGLREVGFDEGEAEMILGGNWYRFLAAGLEAG